jgi:hypothetical protein
MRTKLLTTVAATNQAMDREKAHRSDPTLHVSRSKRSVVRRRPRRSVIEPLTRDMTTARASPREEMSPIWVAEHPRATMYTDV